MKFLQIILFIICTSTFAQEKYSVTGNLTSENDQKTIQAEVVLYDDLQNVVQTIHTDDSNFEFKELEPKTYSISIIHNNAIQEEKPFYLNENKTFRITINETILISEVIVKGRKETFKIENGNLIVDVANSNFNKTTNSSACCPTNL